MHKTIDKEGPTKISLIQGFSYLLKTILHFPLNTSYKNYLHALNSLDATLIKGLFT